MLSVLRASRGRAFLRSSQAFSAPFHAGARREDEATEAKVYEPAGPEGILGWVQNLPATAVVPMGLLAGLAAQSNGVWHLNDEVQILALFGAFIGTVYSQGGDAIAKYFDDTAKAILDQQNLSEEAEIASLHVLRDLHVKQTGVHDEMANIFQAQTQLMDDLVVAKTFKLQHDVRDKVVRMMDTLVVQEANTQREVQQRLVEEAVKHVRGEATSDAMRTSALNEALEIIANPKQGAGEDAIGGLFQNYFKGFNARVEAARNQDTPIPANVALEMEESAAALANREGLSSSYKAPASIQLGNF